MASGFPKFRAQVSWHPAEHTVVQLVGKVDRLLNHRARRDHPDAPQFRVILRALVNLDPYTFADDLAEDTAEENDKRSAEEVLLALIEGTGDDKLTSFAVRLALAGHRGIPREGDFDFLAEAEAAFLAPKPKKSAAAKKKEPTSIKPTKAAAKKAKGKPAENTLAA